MSLRCKSNFKCSSQQKLLGYDLEFTQKTHFQSPLFRKDKFGNYVILIYSWITMRRQKNHWLQCNTMPIGSGTIWEVFKTFSSEPARRSLIEKRGRLVRKLCGGMTVLLKLQVKKTCFREAQKKRKASKEKYLVAKRASKHVAYDTKKIAVEKNLLLSKTMKMEVSKLLSK